MISLKLYEYTYNFIFPLLQGTLGVIAAYGGHTLTEVDFVNSETLQKRITDILFTLTDKMFAANNYNMYGKLAITQ